MKLTLTTQNLNSCLRAIGLGLFSSSEFILDQRNPAFKNIFFAATRSFPKPSIQRFKVTLKKEGG